MRSCRKLCIMDLYIYRSYHSESSKSMLRIGYLLKQVQQECCVFYKLYLQCDPLSMRSLLKPILFFCFLHSILFIDVDLCFFQENVLNGLCIISLAAIVLVLCLFVNIKLCSFLKKDFIYLLSESGREGERKGEKHQCVVASCAPPAGDLPCNPGICPDWGLNLCLCCSQASIQSTEPHQPGLKFCSYKGDWSQFSHISPLFESVASCNCDNQKRST